MGDFLKIFFIVCGMAVAFFVGKGYGEQTFFASDDFKNIAKTRDELDYTRSELENAKAKLQNIINGAERQKTDELLAQILQVFLADLGLQIQNREAILTQAKQTAAVQPAVQNSEPAPNMAELKKAQEAIEKLKEEEKRERKELALFADKEHPLLSFGASQRNIDNVTIKNLKKFLSKANPEMSDCEKFLGKFRGTLKNINNKEQGSIFFELGFGANVFKGSVAWLDTPKPPISNTIYGSCGQKIDKLSARFFTLSDSRYIQAYPVESRDRSTRALAGILYEILPQGSTQKIGTFLIQRGI